MMMLTGQLSGRPEKASWRMSRSNLSGLGFQTWESELHREAALRVHQVLSTLLKTVGMITRTKCPENSSSL